MTKLKHLALTVKPALRALGAAQAPNQTPTPIFIQSDDGGFGDPGACGGGHGRAASGHPRTRRPGPRVFR